MRICLGNAHFRHANFFSFSMRRSARIRSLISTYSSISESLHSVNTSVHSSTAATRVCFNAKRLLAGFQVPAFSYGIISSPKRHSMFRFVSSAFRNPQRTSGAPHVLPCKINPASPIEVSTVGFEAARSRLQSALSLRHETMDHEKRRGNDRRISLLCLDGGGVRGLSSLHILQRIMEGVNPGNTARPCDYFDMICGTSTGGLIAIMLGRLQLSVPECIEEYQKLSTSVFTKRRHRLNRKGQLQGRFDHEALEEGIKDLLRRRGLSEDELLKDTGGNLHCKS